MSKKIFSKKEQAILRKNRHVLRISDKAITYTDDFKVRALAESSKGKTAREIFEEAGFDVELIGMSRVTSSITRWKTSYKEKGVMGLRDTRKGNSGRPLNRELSPKEIIERKDAEIAYLKAELELVKKLDLKERSVRKGKIKTPIIYDLISSVINEYKLDNSVSHLCELAGVSRSGYYRHKNAENYRNAKNIQDSIDYETILKAYNFKNCTKGSRGIYMVLLNEFKIEMNRKKIQRLMRKFNLRCPIRKINPYRQMAKATKEHRVVPNKLQRKFKDGEPGEILLTDITYLPFKGSFAYLSAIKDSVTNEILAYKLSDNIKLDIAMDTIDKLMAKHKDRLHKNSYIHSDQGVHYTSPKFQNKLKNNQLGQSMSRKGNCWDNAPMESFFGHMKDEINYDDCDSFDELSKVIDEYIDYYNKYRYQWDLNKMTPIKYREYLFDSAQSTLQA